MKRFTIVFFLVLLGFGVANVASMFSRSDDENGGQAPDWLPTDRYGVPVIFLERGGVNPNDEHVTYFSKPALIVDVGITVFVCGAVATASAAYSRRPPHTHAS